MRRILGGVAVAMGVTAIAAIGQTMLGRELLVLVLDQEYAAGNDTWPFHLVLLTWFIASAVVLGCAAARPIAGEARWRYALAAAAGLAALAPISPVLAWASGATSVADPVLAVLGGTVVGAWRAWPSLPGGVSAATSRYGWRGCGSRYSCGS